MDKQAKTNGMNLKFQGGINIDTHWITDPAGTVFILRNQESKYSLD
jgi:hypothetical protein